MFKHIANLKFFLKSDAIKLYITILSLVAVCCAIIIRLGFIYFGKKVQHYRLPSSLENKQSILAENGNFLAISVRSKDLYIDPIMVIDKKQTIDILVKHFTHIKRHDIEQRLNKKRWILIDRFITDEKLVNLIKDGLIGIKLQSSKKRIYPESNMFSHIVGYSDIDGNGLAGLERYYNNILYENDIITSLNYQVQSIVHDTLSESVNKNDAKSAFAIIMDISTGEVVSSVSLPDYNPNESINTNSSVMSNVITSSALEVGSVFKIFTLAFALENGLNQNYKIKIKDGITLEDGKIIKDDHAKNDELTIQEIFYKSSNVGSGMIATMFGERVYVKFLQKLGVYNKVLTNLPDGEIASPIFNKNDFSKSRIVTTSYGYGVSLSPLHFTAIANGVINGGKYLPPTFIKGGNIGVKPRQIVSKQTSQKVVEISNKVVTEGTAKMANISSYKICGKTGTSQKFDHKTKTWSNEKKLLSFFAIFPCTNPKYVMYLGIDEPHPTEYNKLYSYANLYGGTVAAPTAAKIISIISPMLNIKADKESN